MGADDSAGPISSGYRMSKAQYPVLKMQFLVDFPHAGRVHLTHPAVEGHQAVDLVLHVGQLGIHRRRQSLGLDQGQNLRFIQLFHRVHPGCRIVIHAVAEFFVRRQVTRALQAVAPELRQGQHPPPVVFQAHGPIVYVAAFQVAAALVVPAGGMEQARKLGDTPFICAGIRADIDEKAFLPMSAVNALRRDASAKLLESLHWRRSCDSGDVPKLKNQPAEHTRITAIASTLDQAKAAFGAGADEVALEPWEFHITAFEAAAAFKGSKKLLISLPVAIISHKEAEKIMKIIGSGLIDGGIAANVGQLELIRSLPLRIAGTQMNAMNGYTVQAYKDMGFDRVTLSLELTKPQMRDISGAGTAVSVYGRAQLMQLRHCPVKEYRGCRSCDGFTGKMVDEGGREFPLCNVRQEDGCLVRLLNCLPTDITDLYGELPEPEAVQLAFYDEAPEKVRERIAAAMAARDGRKVSPAKNATRGHWNRAVD